MELSPEAIVGVEFGTVRKGYDPEEVRQFLMQVARGVEEMRTQLVTSDNRARAALAKLQEVSSQPARSVAPVAAPVSALADQSADMETISRTLMVAQKTADNLVAEAQTQSAQIVSAAEERARAIVAEAERRSAERVAASENEARARGKRSEFGSSPRSRTWRRAGRDCTANRSVSTPTSATNASRWRRRSMCCIVS